MHEITLHALLPAAHHEHTLKILAGISAMQPIPIKEQHIIYKPGEHAVPISGNVTGKSIPASIAKPSSAVATPTAPPPVVATAAVTGSKAKVGGELVYLSLIADLPLHSSASSSSSSSSSTSPLFADEQLTWTLSIKSTPDIPRKNARGAISRSITSINLPSGDPNTLVTGLGYEYISSYIVVGDRFTTGFIGVRVYAIVPLPRQSQSPSQPADLPDDTTLAKMPRLDPAGSFQLEASVMVTDGSKPELMETAFAELGAFRDLLDGVVGWSEVERLVLDSRVKNHAAAVVVNGSGSGKGGIGMGNGVGIKV